MKHVAKALLLAALLPVAVMAQEKTQFIKGSWEEITARARKEHKPIFIDTYFEGCHACKDMEVKVFPRPEVKQYMEENYVNTGFDVFKEKFGMDLCVKYYMRGFPTYLVIAENGELINRGIGYQEPDRFLEFLQENVARNKAGKYLSGFSTDVVSQDPAFYKALFDKGNQGTDQAAVAAYLGETKDMTAETTFKVMLIAKELPAAYREYFIRNRAEYVNRFGEDLSNTILDRLLAKDLTVLPATYDKTAFDNFLLQQQQVYSTADWAYVRMYYAENYLYRKCKQAKAFLEFAVAHPDTNDNRVRYMSFYLGPDLSKDPSLKELYIRWAAPVLTKKSSLEVLQTLAYMCKDANKEQAKKYFTWALEKATAFGQNTDNLKKSLQELSI
ncbi:thioredoxin fold domain-containing protein [Chitinophaga sp. Mgbs1]|uniref:Thioredoxin fold domain-containing protein n=1 Tax=Chitinophaga solisilvae TaxID=1233460 RepID=A0A3S1BFL7_9BACT|nr:thioredoxin fold domain-containing protein [Chitinophaga solisilvae]